MDKNKYSKKFIESMFKAKEDFHKHLASEPIEAKIKKLIELQKIHSNILISTGRKLPEYKKVWKLK